MTTWRRNLARSAWTALLLLFAVRAIAGPALCELYGEHRVPPGSVQAGHIHGQPVPGERVATSNEYHAPTGHSSNDRPDHVCEETVYLTGNLAAASALKWSLAHDGLAWTHAPLRVTPPAALTAGISLQQLTHPPPSRAPLDVSPRLRI